MIASRPLGLPVRLVLAAVLLCAAAGCAYRQAMARAEEHAVAQRWREAVAEYRNALALSPGDEDALAGLAAAAPGAIAHSLVDGEAALAGGDFETAVYHRDYALGLDPTHADALALGARVQAQMEDLLRQLVEGGRMEEAYGFANRTAALFPAAPTLPQAYETIRGWFLARAEEYVALRDFGSALSVFDTILVYEPAQAGPLGARIQQVRGSWADDVVAQAKGKHAAGRPAAAAALFARAFEIAGRPGDQAQVRELVVGLRQRGLLHVFVGWGGDGNRLATVRPGIEAGIAGLSGAQLVPDPSQADLLLRVDTGAAGCDQTARSWQSSQSYVAGYNQYENPTYRSTLDEITSLQRSVGDAEVRRSEAQAGETRAWAEASAYEASWMQPVWSELSQLRSRIDSTAVQLDGRRRLVAEMEAEIEAARARGASEDALLASQMTLGGLRQDVIELENQLYLDQNRLAELQGQESSHTSRYQELRGAAESWSYQVQSIDGELQGLRSSLDAAQSRLQSTSPTVTEEIPGTFTFDVTEWTRICGGDLLLGAEPRWGGAVAETLTYTNRWQTVDQTNEAFPDYGVGADPLAFQLSDWDLTVQADLASVDQLMGGIASFADRYFEWRWQTGSAAGADPDTAAEQLLLTWLAAPDRVGDAALALLQQLLAVQYGLQDPGLLAN
jgi:tetratricopeptide (TPR) repeat protein